MLFSCWLALVYTILLLSPPNMAWPPPVDPVDVPGLASAVDGVLAVLPLKINSRCPLANKICAFTLSTVDYLLRILHIDTLKTSLFPPNP